MLVHLIRTFVRDVQHGATRLAMHRVAIVALQSTDRAWESDFGWRQQRLGKIQEQSHAEDHDDDRYQATRRARQGDIAETGRRQRSDRKIERVGMYGLILVEPEAGLSKVDREFYVMQGEIYTDIPYGQHGSAEFSVEKLLDEHPEYFVLNGSVGALAKLHPLHAKVGETVRIFFGVGGPNFTSSFHVIGEIFDRVYLLGGVLSKPLEGIQTVSVAPGGAVIVEFKAQVPGNYTIVDHALTRLERGLVGILSVEGASNPDIFNGQTMTGMGH